jgi:hypothetical protein
MLYYWHAANETSRSQKQIERGKIMKTRETYCGMLYESPAKEKYIGSIYRLGPDRFVIRRPTEFGRPGQFDWESAEFPASAFRRCGGLNLGYGREVHYVPAVAG